MNNRKWVENVIIGIIALNIFVLAFVFLIPRAQFIIDHWGRNAETLMETSGAKDTPNQYAKTYEVVNSIRKITREDSIIFIPAENGEIGSNRSVVIQRLYPRKVFFSGDPESVKSFSKASKLPNAYIVFSESGRRELCAKESVKYLEVEGIGICRTGK